MTRSRPPRRRRACALLVSVAIGGWIVLACGKPDLEEVEALASWSPDQMRDLEPQIEQQYSRTLGRLQKSLEGGLSGAELAEPVGELGMLHQVYQNQELAVEAYSVAERLDSGDCRWPYYRGVQLARLERLDEAGAALETSLDCDPSYIPTRIRLAEVATQSGDLDRASELYSVIGNYESSARVLAGLGELELARGNYVEAARFFEQASTLDPNNQRIRIGYGRALQKAGQPEQARDVLSASNSSTAASTELALDDPLIARLYKLNIGSQQLWHLGRNELTAGRGAAASDYFRRALEITPDSNPIRTDLATSLAIQGDYDSAVAMLESILDQEPYYLPALSQLGLISMQQRRKSKAIEVYEYMLTLDPGLAEIHTRLGDILRIDDQLAAAAEHYVRAIELQPLSQDAYVWLAWIRYLEGSPDSSLATLRSGLEQLPESAWLRSLEMRMRAVDPPREQQTRYLTEARELVIENPSAFNAETMAMLASRFDIRQMAIEWQTAALNAARRAEAPVDIMEARLDDYRHSTSDSHHLDRADIETARVALLRDDLTRLARIQPQKK